MDVPACLLWEIECYDDHVTIRFIKKTTGPRKIQQNDSQIKIEIYESTMNTEAHAFLIARQEAKKNNKPFFSFLSNIIKKSV